MYIIKCLVNIVTHPGTLIPGYLTTCFAYNIFLIILINRVNGREIFPYLSLTSLNFTTCQNFLQTILFTTPV